MIKFSELVDELEQGCKKPVDFKIGVEWEQFLFNKNNNKPLPYSGTEISIENLLNNIAQKDNWQKIFEGNNIIALQKNSMGITLEPAGQFEYAGSPLKSIAEVSKELKEFQNSIKEIADEINIGFLAKGLHPNWTQKDIYWMPKQRYDIMKSYMPKQGKHGLDMMTLSCGTQINLDFQNEEDMIKKYRVSLALQPIIIALMANSQIFNGKDTGYKTYRNYVWEHTDKNRASFPKFVFMPDMSFAKYVDYALDVPMYLIYRNGKYIDMTNKKFRDFMQEKEANIKDWQLHLTTLFPPVRLKRYLELRSADSNNYDMILAMASFWVGILYDRKTLNLAYEKIMNIPVTEIEENYKKSAKYGISAIYDMACEFLELAKTGLKNQSNNKNCLSFLQPFISQNSELS